MVNYESLSFQFKSNTEVFVYYRVQAIFRATTREVKRLEAVSRSPIFQHFSEAIAGLETIRYDILEHLDFPEPMQFRTI